MGSALLITLREGLEAALVVGIVFAYLAKTGNRDKRGPVWLGVAAAVLLSVVAGAVIFVTAGELEGWAEQVFEGVATLTAASVLTYMIFWMRRQAIGLRQNLQAQIETALRARSTLALGLVAFTAVGREGIETALFLFAAGKTGGATQIWAGGSLGLALAVLLGYLLYSGTYRLNLRAFFNVTSILLLVFAAGLVAHGIHEFNEAGLVPALVADLWNTNRILDERSVAGSFLKALFGYDGNPSLSEVIGYLGYLVGVGWLYLRPAPEPRTETEGAGV